MKKLISAVLVIIVFFLGVLWYLGVFSSLSIEEKEMGPYTMVYAEHIWDYKKVWSLMDDIYEVLKESWVEQIAGIWIYYDNPAIVLKEELRSEIWSVISSDDVLKLLELGISYKIKTIEPGEKIVVEFPYKNMLSYMIWPMKVYPIMEKYMIEKWYEWKNPAIEIYDIANKKIYFMSEK